MIVHRYLVWKDVSLQTVPSAQFADDAQIAEWAKESVYVCRSAGIVHGMGDNHFAPNVTAVAVRRHRFSKICLRF